MIKRELTNAYLADFDLLTESLYLCWIQAFNVETNSLNKSLMRELIMSQGSYKYKHITTKENYTNLTDNFRFKHLTWVNQFLEQINQDTFTNHIELYKQVISEIESNLFVLKSKPAQIAYANVLLKDLDKSHIHKLKFDSSESNRQYKEAFETVIDLKSLTQTDSGNTNAPLAIINYDLSVRLINHLDFIDKLIDLFACFGIDLTALSEKYKHNLYIFDAIRNEFSIMENWGSVSIGTAYISSDKENKSRIEILPKFQSSLSNDCLINIMHYLYKKKKLEKPNVEIWLFWFNRKCVRTPEPLKWIGSHTMLSNVIQQVCGECVAETIKAAFDTKNFI